MVPWGLGSLQLKNCLYIGVCNMLFSKHDRNDVFILWTRSVSIFLSEIVLKSKQMAFLKKSF